MFLYVTKNSEGKEKKKSSKYMFVCAICIHMARGIRALSKRRIYSEEGAGEPLSSMSVQISLYFQLGWHISQINLKILTNLLLTSWAHEAGK